LFGRLNRILGKTSDFALSEGGPLKARIVRGGMWLGASAVFTQLLSVARSIIFARLLAPDDFGLFALAGIVIGAVETLSRPGVHQALIARQSAIDEAGPTALSLLAMRGLLLAAAIAAVAPWVADFYDTAELTPILHCLALTFVFAGFNNVSTIAIHRELDFRRLAYISQSTAILSTLTTIVLAYFLRNVWALVIGQVASSAFNTLLSYVFVRGRLQFQLKAGVARQLLGYGKFITASSVVIFAAARLDSAVIGKLLGTEQLGYYSLAFTIAGIATLSLSRIASDVMFPAFSKLQTDHPALRHAYLRTLSMTMHLVLPAAVGLVVIAEPFLQVIYGGKWLPAAVLLKILAIFGVFRALFSFTGYLFEGIGMPHLAFVLGTIRLLAVALLIVPMTEVLGTAGAAISVTIGGAVCWYGSLVYLRQVLGLNLSDVARSLWRPSWTTAVMASAVVLLNHLVNPASLRALSVVVLVGAASYVGLNVGVLRSLRRMKLSTD
jgi:O-antigen/teichoic acid export membrane protein